MSYRTWLQRCLLIDIIPNFRWLNEIQSQNQDRVDFTLCVFFFLLWKITKCPYLLLSASIHTCQGANTDHHALIGKSRPLCLWPSSCSCLSAHRMKMQLNSYSSFLCAQHCTCRRFRASRRRITAESVGDSSVSRMRQNSCFSPTTSSIVCGIAWRHLSEELSGGVSLCTEPLDQRLQAMQRALHMMAGSRVASNSRPFLLSFAQVVHLLCVLVHGCGHEDFRRMLHIVICVRTLWNSLQPLFREDLCHQMSDLSKRLQRLHQRRVGQDVHPVVRCILQSRHRFDWLLLLFVFSSHASQTM